MANIGDMSKPNTRHRNFLHTDLVKFLILKKNFHGDISRS